MQHFKPFFTLLFLFLSYSFITASSCKKDEDPTPPTPTVLERIQGRWIFNSVASALYNHNTNALLGSQTIAGAAGDYFEFRSNNKVYVQVFGTRDTGDYRLLNDTKLLFGQLPVLDTFDIVTLTGTDFVMRNKQVDVTVTPPERDETTFTLKK
jgi:hypothetical protein